MDKEGVVTEDLHEQKQFIEARAGDHLMIEFQCDVCHFWNIQCRDADPKDAKEEKIIFLWCASNDVY